ncbi:hypothetical protein [Methylobacterium dankookense]|uniref:Uncharacterized protein n=1 Tax=Methylobacterium dankookense TaxID=560405 RepID=A0A564G4V6_9HYPH|nr:hypothetical protein [Methylobacterium dankookense]GJD59816.1 hypothetical protein IFDJLNFL_5747 [Methylobacterium dankookense]VUF15074.1 hypothetical protein MTDSW087_04807 [Methylobacterium dankookense]
MPSLTRFMAQGYTRLDDGLMRADEPLRFMTPGEAIDEVERLAPRRAGAVAYKWVGDERNGETGRISLLRHVGVIPVYVALALGIEEESCQLPRLRREAHLQYAS